MSEENVEIVRRYLKGGVVTVPPDQLLAWVAEFWEPDGDCYPVRGFAESRPCHGREEIANYLAEVQAAWEVSDYVVENARAIGDDRVFVHSHMRAVGRGTDARLEGDTYHCCWLRHGRLIRAEDHLSEKEALHALGFSGETLEAAGLSE